MACFACGITINWEFGSNECISADILTGRNGLESGCISKTGSPIDLNLARGLEPSAIPQALMLL